MINAYFRPFRYERPASAATSDWQPAVDIVEHKDRFELLADLPGVAPDDIDINLHENVLSIAGRRAEQHADQQRCHGERAGGNFCRRFTLPGTVDGDGIAARAEHGVLKVSIPKLPDVQPRRIDIAA